MVLIDVMIVIVIILIGGMIRDTVLMSLRKGSDLFFMEI